MYNLSIDIDSQSKKTLYMQIYEYIIAEIKKGNLKEKQKLPSKRKLAESLRVSVNTVDFAYQMLCSEGYIEAKPQSGFYVCGMEKLFCDEVLPRQKPHIVAKEEKTYLYDATTGNIDAKLFPYKIWGRLQRSVLSVGDSLLGYGDKNGDIALRRAISGYLHEYRGVNCFDEQIVVGAGLEYLLGLLSCLFKDKVFAIENPGYKKVYEIIENNGCKVEAVPVDKYGINVDKLLISGADIAYVTPSHQYPTGASMPASRRYGLLSWAMEKHGRYIVEDDYDSEFRFDRKPISALQGLDENGRVIYLGTFSRCLAPSIRIAYMVLPVKLLEEFNKMFGSYSATVSRMEQHTLACFIEEGHFARHLSRIRTVYKKRRDYLVNALYEEFGKENIAISGEHTGIHLLASFKSTLSEEYICSEAEKRGIKIKGLAQYRKIFCDESQNPTLVLGYGNLSEKEISEVCRLLKEIFMLNE